MAFALFVLTAFPLTARAMDAAGKQAMMGALYQELRAFKNREDFHLQGFAEHGPYRLWHERVIALAEDEAFSRRMLKQYDVIPNDLYNLGREYMKSQGRETAYSRKIDAAMKRVFAGQEQNQ